MEKAKIVEVNIVVICPTCGYKTDVFIEGFIPTSGEEYLSLWQKGLNDYHNLATFQDKINAK